MISGASWGTDPECKPHTPGQKKGLGKGGNCGGNKTGGEDKVSSSVSTEHGIVDDRDTVSTSGGVRAGKRKRPGGVFQNTAGMAAN